MEAASEKRKRGRPRAHPVLEHMPASMFTAGTARGRNNYLFAIEALDILGCGANREPGATPFPLLVDWPAANAKKRGAVKFGVLTELGRASRELSPALIRLMAKQVHDALAEGAILTAKEAELYVRLWRKKLKPIRD